MRCEYCHENDAENTFIISFPGGTQEIHLCSECTEKARQYYEMARRANPGSFPGWGGEGAGRKKGENPFPSDAGGDIRQRRRLNELRTQLKEAVELEHYEEAARLRDELAAAEKDVYAI